MAHAPSCTAFLDQLDGAAPHTEPFSEHTGVSA
jgi:hypothetical protein